MQTIDAEAVFSDGLASAAGAGVPSVRAAVVSDAITDRNGVGTYYADLIAQLGPRLERLRLLAPDMHGRAVPAWFSAPMPGDPTQRMIWPKGRAVARWLDELRPTVIVIPTLGILSVCAMRYARRRGVPTLVVNHTNFDHLLHLYWNRLLSEPLGWGLRRMQHWMLSEATRVAAVDQEGAMQARCWTDAEVPILGTPISRWYLESATSDPAARLRRVVFVGRLAHEKGIDQLLAAAEALPQLDFTIVGDGPLRGCVEQAASRLPNLTALGWLQRRGVLEVIDAHDLLILPSAFETFGTVALEALARRRLVLVRETCGIARHPEFGPGLLQMSAEEPAAAALRRILALTDEQRVQICRRGWVAVRSFNDETLAQWSELLRELSERPDASAATAAPEQLVCETP
jgi:glycosyltransferase involved in cell wall biosynthesis